MTECGLFDQLNAERDRRHDRAQENSRQNRPAASTGCSDGSKSFRWFNAVGHKILLRGEEFMRKSRQEDNMISS
jgi:hypothetical protein